MSTFISNNQLRANEEQKQLDLKKAKDTAHVEKYTPLFEELMPILSKIWRRYGDAREMGSCTVEPDVLGMKIVLSGRVGNRYPHENVGDVVFVISVQAARKSRTLWIEVPSYWQIEPSDLAQDIATKVNATVHVSGPDFRKRDRYVIMLSEKRPKSVFKPQPE